MAGEGGPIKHHKECVPWVTLRAQRINAAGDLDRN